MGSVLLEWKVHLARRNRRGVVLVAAVAFLAGTLGWATKGLAFGLLGFLLVLLAVLDFLLPVRYRLTPEGVEVRQVFPKGFIAWDRVRRCVKAGSDLLLSPFPFPSRLDAYRGVVLRGVPEEAEQIVRKLASKARWVVADGEGT